MQSLQELQISPYSPDNYMFYVAPSDALFQLCREYKCQNSTYENQSRRISLLSDLCIISNDLNCDICLWHNRKLKGIGNINYLLDFLSYDLFQNYFATVKWKNCRKKQASKIVATMSTCLVPSPRHEHIAESRKQWHTFTRLKIWLVPF